MPVGYCRKCRGNRLPPLFCCNSKEADRPDWGKLTVSLPEGEMAPKRISAAAVPVSCPIYQPSTMAETRSFNSPSTIGRPFIRYNTTGLPSANTASASSFESRANPTTSGRLDGSAPRIRGRSIRHRREQEPPDPPWRPSGGLPRFAAYSLPAAPTPNRRTSSWHTHSVCRS